MAFLEGEMVPGFEIEFMQVYKDGEKPEKYSHRRMTPDGGTMPQRWPPRSMETRAGETARKACRFRLVSWRGRHPDRVFRGGDRGHRGWWRNGSATPA